MIKPLIAPLVAACVAGYAVADDFRGAVITCLSGMQTDEDWTACRMALFSRCPTQEAGAPEHVACLKKESAGWEKYLDNRNDALAGKLTDAAGLELGTLRGRWRGYVARKCATVAVAHPAAGESARLGCRISEIAGFAAELAYCQAGMSTEPYCVLKE
ncbi:MAG: hypothetical protein GDA53_01295 [Rhodobacteraceae bacterium]|nr:hypothetical protein [Paracoccaceae bacterium]